MNGVTYKDEPIKKIYWTVGEVAAELHVHWSLIHYWMKEFHIEVKRSRHNWRMFTAEDRERLREIYFLVKVEMFTLKGARKQLESHD